MSSFPESQIRSFSLLSIHNQLEQLITDSLITAVSLHVICYFPGLFRTIMTVCSALGCFLLSLWPCGLWEQWLKSKWLTSSQLSQALQSCDDLILCLSAPSDPLIDPERGASCWGELAPSAGDTLDSNFIQGLRNWCRNAVCNAVLMYKSPRLHQMHARIDSWGAMVVRCIFWKKYMWLLKAQT